MRTIRWGVSISLLTLTVGCGADDDSKGGATPDAGSGGSGGASGGSGGAGGSGGTSGTGGAAGTSTGGAGGSTGGSGGSSGSAGSAASGGSAGVGPGCTGASDVVCVEIDGIDILFQSPAGETLARRVGPDEYALPPGGMVTLIDSNLETYSEVPVGTTIRRITEQAPVPVPMQSLRITVPEWRPGAVTNVATGCDVANPIQTGVPIVLPIDDRCVVGGTAEILVSAFDPVNTAQRAKFHVTDIAVGAAAEPTLDVTFGSWVTTEPTGTITLDHIPPGLTAKVQLRSFRGAGEIQSGVTTFARQSDDSGTASIFAFLPATGTEWVRDVYAYDPSAANQFSEISWVRETVGHPLALTASVSSSRLLPIPSDVTRAASTVSWTGGADAETDRVLVTLVAPTSRWSIWAPPETTSITLPSGLEIDAVAPAPVEAITVRVEDFGGIDGYVEAIERWGRTALPTGAPATTPARYAGFSAIQ